MVHYDDDLDEIHEEIDPEEEEKLDDALKQVLHEVPGCTVDQQTIRDMLWDSYYDVGATVAYCVDKTAKAQKAQQLKADQIAAKQEKGEYTTSPYLEKRLTSEEEEPNTTTTAPVGGSTKPLSKLAALAKARAEARSANSAAASASDAPSDVPTSKFSKLRKLGNGTASGTRLSSGLDGLKSSRSGAPEGVSGGSSALNALKNRSDSKLSRLSSKRQSPPAETAAAAATATGVPRGASPGASASAAASPAAAAPPTVDYTNIAAPKQPTAASAFGQLFCTRISHRHIPANPVAKAKTAAANFSQPSPDDVVLSKQKGAELADSVAKLNLSAPVAVKTDFSKWKPKIQVGDSVVKAVEPALNAVAVGHVDAGKSTLLGHLLHDTGAVNAHAVEKLEKSAAEIGKKSFAYAWLMDQTDEERENGVTVDVSVKGLTYDDRAYVILDAPGHYNFVPNMIAGASQADVAVLVLDSLPDAFERGFYADGQTKEHALLCRAMGVPNICIAVNKMDPNFKVDRYEEIKIQMGDFLERIGYDKPDFVPCSGITGANVVKRHPIPWYNGDTIMGHLSSLHSTAGNSDKPLKMDIFNVRHDSFGVGGITVAGRLFDGLVQIDQPVVISPGMQVAMVRNIQIGTNDSKPRNFAKSGENVQLALEAVDGCPLEEIKAGDILSAYSDPVKRGNKFRAKVTFFDVDLPILKGTQCDFYRGRVATVAVFSKLYDLLDKTGASIKSKPRYVDKGQTAFVELILSDVIALELAKNNKHLGRFVLRRDGKTIGFGSVEKVARNLADTTEVAKVQIGDDIDEEEEE